MSMTVTFSDDKGTATAKGTAGLQTQLGGIVTTVSAIQKASEEGGDKHLVKKSIG